MQGLSKHRRLGLISWRGATSPALCFRIIAGGFLRGSPTSTSRHGLVVRWLARILNAPDPILPDFRSYRDDRAPGLPTGRAASKASGTRLEAIEAPSR